jgi:PAS domain-containing protein
MEEESGNGPFHNDGSRLEAAHSGQTHSKEKATACLDLLQHLLDSSPFGILVHDADGKLLAYSRQVELDFRR